MKPFIYICFLVVVIGPCVKAKSFNFGNLFLGSSKKALDSNSAIPPAASQSNLFDSEPLDYSTEVESEVSNSSSDDIFDFDYQNSSSDSLDASSRNESDNVSIVPDNTTAPVVAAAAVAEVQDNETHPSDKNETTTSVSSTVTSEKTTTLAEVPSTANVSKENPSTFAGEQEEVVLGTTTGATAVLIPKTFFQKSIDWVEDAYTLSILIPITAGILFATTIIVVIALFSCVRRCCRRRRFKRKPLPDSVKNLRPSDRARLLGDTSDEEF
ncbi:hypothetical protein AVEN_37396-1 [Araneus ventricosus]|uniref:Uncharacterized protein n=1 Tax=Araneus ventricosus TaxID=182803 RepID=A0A4Y2M1G2_ARAVE|nr:hypothetical protein AVEN_37396-1 [Araneus ventricosus]